MALQVVPPNTRVQRTRSSPSAPHSPLTRRPLGGARRDRAVIRWSSVVWFALILGVGGCRDERWVILTKTKEYLSSAPNQMAGVTSRTTPPRCVSRIEPEVPEKCRKLSVQGAFVWEAMVTETGTVEKLQMMKAPVVSPPCPALEAELRKAIIGSKYEVTTIEGHPTSVVMTIEQSITVQ
jgi:hypothetical protein